nr:MAG TPA: hypothetical protein [Caudoviricetes sp.]
MTYNSSLLLKSLRGPGNGLRTHFSGGYIG